MSHASDRPADKIKVLVVEDQPHVLKQQLKVLWAAPQLEVVGTASSGEAALNWLSDNEKGSNMPGVILEDLGLPGISGIEVTREVKKRWPKIEVLIFTIFDEEEAVIDAVKAGASGYLLKGATTEKILEAIREVHWGGTIIQPNLARRLLQHFKVPESADAAIEEKPMPPGNSEEPPTRPLTEREIEVLRLVAKGLSNLEAAGVLKLSRATIRTHLEHVYEKLDVNNRVEAVTEGLRKGLIEQ